MNIFTTFFTLQTRLQGVERLVYNIQPEIFFYSQKPVNTSSVAQAFFVSACKQATSGDIKLVN